MEKALDMIRSFESYLPLPELKPSLEYVPSIWWIRSPIQDEQWVQVAENDEKGAGMSFPET